MKAFVAAILLAIGLALQGGVALAHHGWAWTTGESVEMAGTITAVRLGNPHGTVTIDVEGEAWTVEVGQPWRNERAGVREGDLVEGVEIRVIGEPAVDETDKRIKAIRFYLGDREYILYNR